jgi:hypothetical protein
MTRSYLVTLLTLPATSSNEFWTLCCGLQSISRVQGESLFPPQTREASLLSVLLYTASYDGARNVCQALPAFRVVMHHAPRVPQAHPHAALGEGREYKVNITPAS